jgi:hypothetical protein
MNYGNYGKINSLEGLSPNRLLNKSANLGVSGLGC